MLDEDSCLRHRAADPGECRGAVLIVVTDTGFENFTDFLPMERDDIERLVLEKGVVQKVPPTPAAAIPKRR